MHEVSSPVRVVVADHHSMARAGFVALLDSETGITVVGEAETGAELVHVVLATHPDVVLLDASLPTVDGHDAAHLLFDAHDTAGVEPPRTIMVVASEVDEGRAYEALRLGASGILPRDARPAELAAGVRTAAADDALVGGAALLRLVRDMSTTDGESSSAMATDSLDDPDVRIAAAVATGFSDADIAAHFGVDERIVRDRVRAVTASLGRRVRAEVVILGHDAGLVRGASHATRA